MAMPAAECVFADRKNFGSLRDSDNPLPLLLGAKSDAVVGGSGHIVTSFLVATHQVASSAHDKEVSQTHIASAHFRKSCETTQSGASRRIRTLAGGLSQTHNVENFFVGLAL
jgi:hypothetical protein